MKPFPYAVLSAATLLSTLTSAGETPVETIEVTTRQPHLHGDENLSSRLAQAGITFSAAGGVSALPVMNGMMGDRIQLLTDGVPVTAACGNQMNPPLSYVSANQVNAIAVLPGVSPVSAGGDNIAGVIALSTFTPAFNTSDMVTFEKGSLGYFYQSNDNGRTLSADATVASDTWYLSYAGNQSKAESYEDGHGNLVPDTLYKATNHLLSGGYQDASQRLQLSISHQRIPYQGFPNQYMDMTDNTSTGITALYQRQFGDIALDATASTRHTTHEMGFFTAEKTGMMPMNTDSHDTALKLKWTMPADNSSTFVFGQEYYANRLDDWWPAVEGSAMMGPNDYININDGERDRLAAWAEWLSAADKDWQYQVGLRAEYVTTDTGEVQAYVNSSMDGMSMGGMSMGDMSTNSGMMMANNLAAASAFNSADRSQSDTLFDATLLATRKLSGEQSLTLGIARKNRAPNLYERYSWGTSAMATSMIGWFGDGNGYIGNINLAPETASTASVSWQAEKSDWAAEVSIWYTRVSDYIDVDVTGTFNRADSAAGQRNILQFINTDATLTGADVKASKRLFDNEAGALTWKTAFSWQQGERRHGEGNLYQIIPVQNTMSLEYAISSFSGAISWQWTGSKNDVDNRRNENTTDAWSLLHVSTAWQQGNMTFHFDIHNLLDTWYEEPAGGVNIAQFKQTPEQGFAQIAGRGRSFDLGVTLAF